jgi:hypothetical protein
MTIKNPIKIIWIDDDPNHKEDAKNLENKRKELEVIFVSPLKIDTFLERQVGDVDLFLIDDRLNYILESFNRRGLSVAAQIREKLQEIPIYLFSAYREEGIFTTLAEASENLSDYILDLKKIQREGHNILYYDAIDYHRIRESQRESVNTLLNLLNAPEDDHKRIISALPESIKRGLSPQSEKIRSAGNVLAFSKWVRGIFIKLPGFVYNSLYSATKLGITDKTFLNLSSEFESAKYTGVFSKTSPNLWWLSGLRDKIFQFAQEKKPDLDTADPRILTPALFSLDESQISKCIVCGEKYPDTVGINKDDDEDYEPVHYHCSVPHPAKTRVLYYEEARQFSMEK